MFTQYKSQTTLSKIPCLIDQQRLHTTITWFNIVQADVTSLGRYITHPSGFMRPAWTIIQNRLKLTTSFNFTKITVRIQNQVQITK